MSLVGGRFADGIGGGFSHHFKGLVSRDQYFFEGPKNGRWWFSQLLAVFLWTKSNRMFLLASMKCLLIVKIISCNNLLQMLWTGDFDHENASRNPLEVWNVIPEAAQAIQFRGFFLRPMRGEHWRRPTNGEREVGTEIMMRLPEQSSLELVSVFKEANKNYKYIFSWTRQAKNLQTICACT